MRKIVIISVLLLAFVLCTCVAFAEGLDEPVGDDEVLKYVDVNSVNSRLTISGSNAICKVTVYVRSSSAANKVVMTVNYIKSGTGSVGTKTTTVYRSNNTFTGQTTKSLPSHGTYHAKVNIKLYHNTTLIESFNVLTDNVVY